MVYPIYPIIAFCVVGLALSWILVFIRIIQKKRTKKQLAARIPKKRSRVSNSFTFIIALTSIILQVIAIASTINSGDIAINILILFTGIFFQYIIYYKCNGKRTGANWVIGYILYSVCICFSVECILNENFNIENFDIIKYLTIYFFLCIAGALMYGRLPSFRSNSTPIMQLISFLIVILISPVILFVRTILFWITHLLINTFIAMGRSIAGKPLYDGYNDANDEIEDFDEQEENEKRLDEVETQGKDYINKAVRSFAATNLDVSTYTQGAVVVSKRITSMYVEFTCYFKMTINTSLMPPQYTLEQFIRNEKDEIDIYTNDYITAMHEEIQDALGEDWSVKVSSECNIKIHGS